MLAKLQMVGISEGTKFKNLAGLQMWLKDYTVNYHRWFKVENSHFRVSNGVIQEELFVGFPYKNNQRRAATEGYRLHLSTRM
jgi:hypothetical protein